MDENTFTPPPGDGLTLPQIYDFHSLHSANHPAFKFTSQEGKPTTLTWASVSRAIRRGAYLARCDTIPDKGNLKSGKTVAIIANADSISYMILVVSLMRCGQIPFPISPRCSTAAVNHLLTSTNVTHMYTSQDESIQRLVSNTRSEFPLADITVLPMPTFEDFWKDDPLLDIENDAAQTGNVDGPALILHSSGTTAFPKPIVISHRILIQRGYLTCEFYQNVVVYVLRDTLSAESGLDFQKHVISLHSVSMFREFGIVAAVFPPMKLPKPVNPKAVLAAASVDRCTMMACVPSILEEWANDDLSVATLSGFYAVIISSGPLSFDAGERLVDAGVRISPYYSGTEIGCATVFLSDNRHKEWQYVKFADQFGAHFIPQEEPDMYELVALDAPGHRIAAINSHVDGRNAFRTGDLFKRHPSDPFLWRVWGRADDQIVLSTGEKTNPGPVEHFFTRHPKISQAVMFGHGRLSNGILLQFAAGYENFPSDPEAADGFRRLIRELVMEANAVAPTHSRLYDDMVLVAPPNKPFDLTAKGSVRRARTLSNFASEIEDAYNSSAITPHGDYDLGSHGGMAATTKMIVREVIGHNIVPDKDIFQQGCDSLQALRIRNKLEYVLSQQRLTGSPLAEPLPRDVVYEYPSLVALTAFISDRQSNNASPLSSRGSDVQTMIDTVGELTPDLSGKRESFEVPGTSSRPGGAVLVTGTTGSLGCHMMSLLANNPDISHVYAVNRVHAGGATLLQRQIKAMEENGLDLSLLSNGKVTLVEADFAKQLWGTEHCLFDEMKSTVSAVIHAAWTVDFKLKLRSFNDCLVALRRLIDFSREAKGMCHLIFISSLHVLLTSDPVDWRTGDKFMEASIKDPGSAVGLGYSESKWVAEQVLEIAAQTTELNVTIIRAGQLSGAENGHWKVTEWFPTLIRSSRLIGCLPSTEERISWLPVAHAARIITEVLRTDKPSRYLHLLHPRRARFDDILRPIAVSLNVPIVPYDDWLNRLRSLPALPNPDTSPCEMAKGTPYTSSDVRVMSLVEYFGERVLFGTSERWQDSEVDFTQMTLHSPSISSSNLTPLGQIDAHKWLAYWLSVGLL
ncbi:hypothetical protein FPV67DRAFT_1409809 [Lyophyllum atratum]|nr:hypothetical protein FPV67DRAFT_1409809 [Lyophyllum atratum]